MFKQYETDENTMEIQNDINRKIEIFKVISSEKRWFTFQEISQLLHASTKTISRDLVYIKNLVPKDCIIEIKKGYGVQLIMPKDISVKEIISTLFKESLAFQIFIRIVEQKYTTVNSMAEELYIQSYQVTKILKKIEKYLSNFGLKIRRNPLGIIGDEWDVIHVLSHIYYKLYISEEWPFLYNQTFINRCITQLEESLSITLCIGSRREFSYLIAILLMRKHQGYKVHSINHFSKLKVGDLVYNKLNSVLKEIGKTNNVIFSIPEKVFLTHTFECLSYKYLSSEKGILNNERKGYIRNNNLHVIIADFINMLDNKLEENLSENEGLLISFYDYFEEKIHLLNTHYHLKKSEKTTTHYVKKRYQKRFFQVKETYNQWVKKYKITRYAPNEEIANIVMLIEATRIRKETIPKKVLIMTKEGNYWEQYISAVILRKFGNKISLQSKIPMNIEKKDIIEKKHDIDFIISTIPYKLDLIPVIQIQSIITERDFSNIEDQLTE
ncbi:helix-turn-helix domain-containing protein [Bacillus thuringiensis]|uniref:helix-turn-helix domain-containing protein n=1 Tax=Bacillus thuringiensis TaxID=1428 RepID=UPI0026E49629|nr:helix-turn-helix domain-containing protein [Bacillus thuringiensis]MDO6633846.1 helix-turn-helix domain-containing protein [Bacillus thuringiensis]MDO6663147.1 helix-turn-helix domain-containing protein [Bacillus thuringiensis]MDO6704011.1 helix-turn-helix domain-containing protein [Bacillus thuringiensis]